MDKPEISSNQTFTLQVKHIGMLTDLADRTGKNKSELIREAIELLYTKPTEKVTAPQAA